MTDLPVWLQEVRDRADKATPGPWTAEDANPHKPHKRFAFYIPEIMSAPSMPQYDGLTEEDAEFIAHSRADVPRLVELVAEMAEQLECLIPRGCDIECEDCMRRERERYDRCDRQAVLRMLAKYRGEVENNG